MTTATETPPKADELTDAERADIARIGFDPVRAFQEAIGPKRVRRHIWITPPGSRWTIDHDGPHDNRLPEVTAEFCRMTGSTEVTGGIRAAQGLSPSDIFSAYVGAYLRHGWTLEDGYPTTTNAWLWKPAP